MNSKERARAAIARESVDHVPLGFYAVDHDTVEAVIGRPTYVRNKINIQIALWEGRRDEVAESLKADTVDFYRAIDLCDIILPKEAQLLPPRGYVPEDPPKRISDDEWQGSDGRVWKAVRHANEIACIHDPRPPKAEWTVSEFEGEVSAEPPDESVFEVFDHVWNEFRDERYICSPFGGMTAMTLLGGTENGLMMFALQPEVIHAANRQRVARQNLLDEFYVREGAPAVILEQDMGGTNGPLVSPGMFRELCFPYLKERITNLKKRVGQVIMHNCGRTFVLMEMFIEAGVDCYQSLQSTAGMEVGLLKERYGDRLSFWGGVGVEKLIGGEPEDVREDVRTAMERGAPGGGFILGPSHSIAKNTKYENFRAMLDEYDRLKDKF